MGAAGFIILFFLLVFLGIIPGLRRSGGEAARLTFWGIDEPRAWESAISLFMKNHPNLSITYKQISEANYESELIDALAAGSGPDIFMLHNSWLPKHGNKTVPASQDQINISTFRSLFPEIAETNFVAGERIYSLPIYLDTLGVFYNKDIFNNKRIALPPQTWDEFKSAILKTREFSGGKISKSGAALGGSLKSIEHATDILNLLMLQFKTPMVSRSLNQATFNNQNGRAALNFYLQFSSPGSSYYTWSDSFMNSLDSFAQAKTAMIFAYASDYKKVKAKNPFLNFGITYAPQFNKNDAVNFPNYYGLSVSSKSKFAKSAWDFVVFAASNEAIMKSYTDSTLHPPALRNLISSYLADPVLGTFAGQSLTAKDWFQVDSSLIKLVFDNMLQSVISGSLRPDQALEGAASEVTKLMQR